MTSEADHNQYQLANSDKFQAASSDRAAYEKGPWKVIHIRGVRHVVNDSEEANRYTEMLYKTVQDKIAMKNS